MRPGAENYVNIWPDLVRPSMYKVISPATHCALSVTALEWAIGRYYMVFGTHASMLLVNDSEEDIAREILGASRGIVVAKQDWVPDGVWMLVGNNGSGIIYSEG